MNVNFDVWYDVIAEWQRACKWWRACWTRLTVRSAWISNDSASRKRLTSGWSACHSIVWILCCWSTRTACAKTFSRSAAYLSAKSPMKYTYALQCDHFESRQQWYVAVFTSIERTEQVIFCSSVLESWWNCLPNFTKSGQDVSPHDQVQRKLWTNTGTKRCELWIGVANSTRQ